MTVGRSGLHEAVAQASFAATAPPTGRRKMGLQGALVYDATLRHPIHARGTARHAAFFLSSPKPSMHVAFLTEDSSLQPVVNIDAAQSSSTYGTDSTFSAQHALNNGPNYWCSSGGHKEDDAVTWTGVLSSRRKVAGARIQWALDYSPKEMKVLTSLDGEKFEETSCWKEAGTDQIVMFDHPINAKAMSIVMRNPSKYGYFGIQQINMLGDKDDPLLLVNGKKEVTKAAGEAGVRDMHEEVLAKKQCLVAADEADVGLEKCQTALLSSAGRGLFKLNKDNQLEHVGDGKCVFAKNAGDGGQVALKDCADEEESNDFQWELTEKGQLKSKLGNYCLMPAFPLEGVDAAQGGTVTTTSSAAEHPPSSAIDGDDSSYWASIYDPPLDKPVELSVDLNGEKSVQEITIDWEFPAKSFDVQVARDGAWKTIFTTSSNDAVTTKITEAQFPSEAVQGLRVAEGGSKAMSRLDSSMEMNSLYSSKEVPSPELPHNSSAVRVVMREPHPEMGLDQGHSLYGIRSMKITAGGAKFMALKDCDKAAEEGVDDHRDKWFLEPAAQVMARARKKLEIAKVNFL